MFRREPLRNIDDSSPAEGASYFTIGFGANVGCGEWGLGFVAGHSYRRVHACADGGPVASPVGGQVRRLEKDVRDHNVRFNPLYGPALEDNCPCGSRRQTKRCHRAADHTWVAERPPALITGPRTGYTNPGLLRASQPR
jgi:hypothetical protein